MICSFQPRTSGRTRTAGLAQGWHGSRNRRDLWAADILISTASRAKESRLLSRVSHHAAPCPAFGATIRSARRAVSTPVFAAPSVPGRKMCRQTGQDTASVDLFARQPLRVGYPERLPREEIFLDGICRGRLTIFPDGFCRDLAVPSPHTAAAGRITSAHGGPAPNADRAPSDPTHTDERHEWLARHTFVRWRICR